MGVSSSFVVGVIAVVIVVIVEQTS